MPGQLQERKPEQWKGIEGYTSVHRQNHLCWWRAWLNNTTITLVVNNVMDLEPPFVAAAVENGYDEATANIKGRTWYVALTKRF